MRRLLFLLPLVFLVACEASPLTPDITETDDDQSQVVNVIVNIDGGDNVPGRDGDGPNGAPVVRNPGTQDSVVGEEVLLVITVIDPDGDQTTCTLSGAPRTLSIDPDSCIVSGVVSSSSAADSPFVAQVIASDGKSQDSAQFIWNVAEVS